MAKTAATPSASSSTSIPTLRVSRYRGAESPISPTTRPARLNPLSSSRFAQSTQFDANHLRVATYNIHKGVRGLGPRKRLEIHNLGLGVEALDADLVFLQEVRLFHRREARRFPGEARVPLRGALGVGSLSP